MTVIAHSFLSSLILIISLTNTTIINTAIVFFIQPKEKETTEQEEPEEELSEADLPRIQVEVNQLQEEFDKAVVEKHSLQMELQSMNERLKAATELVER